MSILREVIEHFDKDFQLPRNPEKFRDCILERRGGCADEIIFSGVDLKGANLHGFYVLTQYEHPVFHIQKQGIIFIDVNSPVYWRRFAAIKELIHVFDPSEHRFGQEDKIRALLREMEFPYDIIQTGNYDNDPDGRAVVPALALCAPRQLREEMRAKLMMASHEEAVNLKENFCQKFEIPFRYKNFIFTEEFDEILKDVLERYYG